MSASEVTRQASYQYSVDTPLSRERELEAQKHALVPVPPQVANTFIEFNLDEVQQAQFMKLSDLLQELSGLPNMFSDQSFAGFLSTMMTGRAYGVVEDDPDVDEAIRVPTNQAKAACVMNSKLPKNSRVVFEMASTNPDAQGETEVQTAVRMRNTETDGIAYIGGQALTADQTQKVMASANNFAANNLQKTHGDATQLQLRKINTNENIIGGIKLVVEDKVPTVNTNVFGGKEAERFRQHGLESTHESIKAAEAHYENWADKQTTESRQDVENLRKQEAKKTERRAGEKEFLDSVSQAGDAADVPDKAALG